jgi:hypothetical protein
MLLTISTSHKPATDLGYLLHKNPARVQTEDLSFGTGHVFYPEASSERCTAALLVEIDPVALVRGRGPAGEGGQLEQYVNDRPYAANRIPVRKPARPCEPSRQQICETHHVRLSPTGSESGVYEDFRDVEADLRNQYRLICWPAVLKHYGSFHRGCR